MSDRIDKKNQIVSLLIWSVFAIAPIQQLIMEKLPAEARIHAQSKALISNLCMHFLMHLSEQANDFCNK